MGHRESGWRLGARFGVEILTGLLGLFEDREIVLFFYRNVLVACLVLALYLDRLPAWSYARRRSA